jgi:cyclic-di-GMP-binding protein
MPITYATPGFEKGALRGVEIRPKALKSWVETLPLSHILDSAKKVYDSLRLYNRAKVEADVRRDVYDVLAPTLKVIFEELDALYAGVGLPLSEKGKQAVTLNKALHQECGLTFKLLVNEKLSGVLAFIGKRKAPEMLYQIMYHAAMVLRACYRSYTPPPPGVWAELHRTYLYCASEAMLSEPVGADGHCIEHLYVETLLLAVCDPYRLPNQDVDNILQTARNLKGLATLHTERRETPTGGHFLVPVDADRPPKSIDYTRDDPGGPNARLLDTNALVDMLRSKRQRLDANQTMHGTSYRSAMEQAGLFMRLERLWGDPPKRASRRDAVEAQVAICYGLKAAIHFIDLEPKQAVDAEAEAMRAGITLPLISLPNDETSRQFPVHEWEVLNQSAGGLKIRRGSADGLALTVGEIIGVKFIGNNRWSVACVRWITMRDDGGFECGVQILAPQARAVTVKPSLVANAKAREALWLNRIDGIETNERLLTPLDIYNDLREYEVATIHEAFNCRGTSLLERTPKFEVFAFSPS